MAILRQVVSSLENNCLEKVSKHVSFHEAFFDRLPLDVRSKLVKKLALRGLLRDHHLKKLLHLNIRFINLSSCEITDQGLEALSVCKSLIKIDLNAQNQPRTSITADGVVRLAEACPNLQTVYLRRCLKISDSAVVAMATHCPRLTNLNVGGCCLITDRSLLSLADKSHCLESLNISKTQITDTSLIALANGVCRQSLKEVHFANCTAISDSSVIQLVENCHQLNILIFHGCPLITETSRNALEIMRARGSKQISWTVY